MRWKGCMGQQAGVAVLQKIRELEARAIQRADALDSIRRALKAQRALPGNISGVVDRGRARPLLDTANQTESLLRDEARAEARSKIAVDELLAAHCEILRMSAWGQGLLVPAEAALLTANEAYHPWDRVLRFGKLAIRELQSVEDAIDSSDRMAAMERAGEAIQGLRNGIGLLAREKPESELPLMDLASAWSKVIEIASVTTDVEAQCTAEKGAVAAAQAQLEAANQQIIAAAWLNIPARLRPQGR
jgi:hypothetical protein